MRLEGRHLEAKASTHRAERGHSVPKREKVPTLYPNMGGGTHTLPKPGVHSVPKVGGTTLCGGKITLYLKFQ